MKEYEQSCRPTEATTDQNIELVHNLIMWERRSLRAVARQIGK